MRIRPIRVHPRPGRTMIMEFRGDLGGGALLLNAHSDEAYRRAMALFRRKRLLLDQPEACGIESRIQNLESQAPPPISNPESPIVRPHDPAGTALEPPVETPGDTLAEVERLNREMAEQARRMLDDLGSSS